MPVDRHIAALFIRPLRVAILYADTCYYCYIHIRVCDNNTFTRRTHIVTILSPRRNKRDSKTIKKKKKNNNSTQVTRLNGRPDIALCKKYT